MSDTLQTSGSTTQNSPAKDSSVDSSVDFMSLFKKLEETWEVALHDKRQIMDDASIWQRVYRGLVLNQSDQIPFVKESWFKEIEFGPQSWIFLQRLTNAPYLTLFLGECVFLMHTILDEIDGPNTKSKSPDESMKSNGEQNITDIKLSNNGDIDIKNSSIVDRSPLILDQQRSEKCLALWAQQGQSVIDWLEDQPTLEAIECLVECMFRIVRAIDDPKEKWTVETSEKFAILKQFTGQTSKQSDIENLARVLKSVRIPDSVINGVCDFWQDFKNGNKDGASFFHYLGAIIVYANGSRHALAQKAVYYVENLISPFPGGFSPTVSHYSKQLGKLVFWNNSQSCAAFNTAQYEAAKLAFNSHLEKNKVLNIPRVKGSSEDYEYILQNIQLNLSEAFPKSIKMKEIDMDIAVPPKAWPDTTQPQSEQHKHYSKVVYEIIGLKVICSGVDYNYRTKTGIPLYSDYGHAVATASDICVSISVSPSGNDPFSYKVDKCICTIGDFDISFQETRHSLLNRLSIKKFKKNIKHVLIENIQRGVATIFSQLFSHQ